MEKKNTKNLIPYIMTLVVVVLDQLTKSLVVKYIPLGSVGFSTLGGFFQIIHVRNLNAAFGLGNSFPEMLHFIALSVLPVLLLIGIVVVYFKDDTFTVGQRWGLTAILGGGIGNLIDRFFRPLGVVDFIDLPFFQAIFPSGRWPTFNVADMAITISVALIVLFMIIRRRNEKKSCQREAANEGSVQS